MVEIKAVADIQERGRGAPDLDSVSRVVRLPSTW